VGFGERRSSGDQSKAKTALERLFSPEFRNRLDAVVQFGGLAKEVILKVVDKEIARPMARTVEQYLKKPLAELVLFGGLKDGA
jgi:ATP-dependent Clp protease ATP-binding subunit ClpA